MCWFEFNIWVGVMLCCVRSWDGSSISVNAMFGGCTVRVYAMLRWTNCWCEFNVWVCVLLGCMQCYGRQYVGRNSVFECTVFYMA